MLDGLQKLGRALMLPIAVLPAAALMLRLGAPDIFDLPFLFKSGEAVFAGLPLLFAVGVAVGLARDESGAAALGGVVGYAVFRAASTALVPGLDMGVLAGILTGVLAAFLANRYSGVVLPDWLAFFGGRRLVPILAAGGALGLSLASAAIWPPLQAGINSLGAMVIASGPAGAGVYGVLNRLLIPTGLHHILNNVVWFQFGEFAGPSGVVARGDLHRFFAGDPTAGTFMAGFYPVMLCGLPAACLAMYRAAPRGKRSMAGGILASVAATSFLTGVTEPAEYLFMFLAPPLYLLHAALTGLSLAACALIGVKMGFGFSAGALDYVLSFGLGTRAWLILPLGAAWFALYYAVFSLAIRFFDLKTPGREDDAGPSGGESDVKTLAAGCVAALGGAGNLTDVEACITRLRLGVRDQALVDREALAGLGARGVLLAGQSGVQVVLGAKADLVARAMRRLVAQASEVGVDVRTIALLAPLDGQIVPIEAVGDPVFAGKTVGDGLAILPESELVLAPAPGVIGMVAQANHAFSLETAEGLEIFVHVGIDTVKLGGRGFSRLVEPGAAVGHGQPVLRLDLAVLRETGVDLTTPVVISNIEATLGLSKASGRVRAGRDVILTAVVTRNDPDGV